MSVNALFLLEEIGMSAHFRCGTSSSISWTTKRRGIALFFIVVTLCACWGCHGDETSLDPSESGEGTGIEIILPAASDVSAVGRLELTAIVPEAPFRPERSLRVGTSPVTVAVSDLDGDGRRDIVTANRSTGDVSVLFGAAGDSFQPSESLLRVGPSPVAVAVSDLDGDGRRDIVTANSSTGDVSVLFGKADTIRISLTGEPMQFTIDGRIVLGFKDDGEIPREINNTFIVQGFPPPSPDGVDRVIPNFIGERRQGGRDENLVVINMQPAEAEVEIGLADDVGRMLNGSLEIPLGAQRVQLMASGKFTTARNTPFLMVDLTERVKWASSDPNVIGINEERQGEVSLAGTGEATITIESRSETLTVRVTDD
jgi:hypothetical protein